ncbi:MAG: Fe-S cluster assembly protein SufD [Prolixibacteraceae bacterium]|nr:Fe-S cluster assembly protein SufD [Prolixibacteraceae bacterium]
METLNYTATDELTNLYIQNKSVYYEGCPPFMNDLRDKAIELFNSKGIPSKKNENYKFTDLRPVFQNDYDVVPRYVFNEIRLHDMFRCDVPQLNAHVILMINGWYYNRNRMYESLPEGVICCGLQYAANNYPELIEKNYNKLSGKTDDPLTNLNTAFAKDGLFLYVPDNVIIEKPIQIINILNSKTNTLAIQRNMFVLGENSEAKIVFCDHTLNRNYYILNNLTECFVGKSARMGFYAIQNQHNAAANNNNLFISLSDNSDLDTNIVTLNGGIVRNNINVSLDGEHANASVNGIALADQNQHIDNFTFIDHVVPNCTSNQIFKNILDDKSSGAFSGQIHVFPDAQKTEAFQRNNNVLLTENSTMNSKPQLIIDADDVKCSHGATIGRIDEEALFYLRTRGISEKEARLMIMFAFADEVISQIKVPALKERIEELVDRRLKGDLGPCQHCSLSCSH